MGLWMECWHYSNNSINTLSAAMLVFPQTISNMALAFLVLLLLFAPPVAVSQQDFLSIDCGHDANYSGYTDRATGIFYVSDGSYIDAGENHRIAAELEGLWSDLYQTLRSFPSGQRNCYALPTVAGTRYLVRAFFAYGNYDGMNSSSLEFDLHLGANYWDTTYPNARINSVREAIFLAWAGSAPVCLVNTGHGTPFVSVLELRPLRDALYPLVTTGLIVSSYGRRNMGGAVSTVRYPDDPYDRFWWPMVTASPRWENRSTTRPIQSRISDGYAVPSRVLQTAVAASGNDTALTAITWQFETKYSFMILLHFADFQDTQLRQFDVLINEKDESGPRLESYNTSYLTPSHVYTESYKASDSSYSITLVSTNASGLPPMINALEIYLRVPYQNPTTLSQDFDAIMAIKIEYGVKKNWMGDPCFPIEFAWDGVKCSSASGNMSRITSVDLSYNQLSGSIPDSLPSLSSLQVLNVSGNQLSDESLCKNYTGALIFRHDGDSVCNKPSPSSPRNKAAIIAISVVVPVLVVILLLAYFIWWKKIKPNVQPVPINGPTRDPEPDNASGSKKGHGYNLNKTENRQFTYKELEKFTNNFKKFIGQGGFGPVYYGRLEDSTEVAVKMRSDSESSSRGLDEFLAEVKSLTRCITGI